MWDQLKFDFGGTTTTRLGSLVLKFEVYRKDPKHSMTEHLRRMSSMIRELKSAGNVLSDEQQVLAVIRSLPDSWVHMKQILTHNESINNFSDISRHVELEAERQEVTHVATLYAQGERKPQVKRKKNSQTNAGQAEKPAKRRRGKRADLFNSVSSETLVSDASSSSVIDCVTWHARLGNIGQDRMTRLARECHLGSLAKVSLPVCEPCLEGKACRKPFGKAKRADQPLVLIHSDICGPMNVKARHGYSYFLTFIDDYTRFGYVYLIAHRYEVEKNIRALLQK
ncbi:uncharacterized protein LOC113272756 [Papaver somniferum]|uniref:uncharacterized protein LOC113272756 n=1 Tax=Papaver somniferum TaxID=3469 RepID=UPI000E705379|nr:uncharacterized protein LOC113272756 [Papaver somniferum]